MSESGGSNRHAGATRLLWGPHPRRARGPRPTLDIGAITRTGIELADAEGLPAVSMQRLAGLLGVTKMALYRYVPGKTELVALMVDAAIGPYPQEDEEQLGDWRARLASWARELLAAFLRHPWALDATAGPRAVGPCELGWMERAVSALDGTPLSGAERLDATVLLAGHVRAISEQARATGPVDSPEAEVSGVLSELLQAHGEHYPALAAAIGSAADRPQERDQAWEFGLERILDGLAVFMEQRTR